MLKWKFRLLYQLLVTIESNYILVVLGEPYLDSVDLESESQSIFHFDSEGFSPISQAVGVFIITFNMNAITACIYLNPESSG